MRAALGRDEVVHRGHLLHPVGLAQTQGVHLQHVPSDDPRDGDGAALRPEPRRPIPPPLPLLHQARRLRHDGRSYDIVDYNTFVQGRAAAAEHVSSETPVAVVQPDRTCVRHHRGSARLALPSLSAVRGLPPLPVCLGVRRDRATVRGAIGLPAPQGLFRREDPAAFDHPLQFRSDARVGLHRRIVQTRLASNRGGRTAAGRMHLVAGIPAFRRTGLDRLDLRRKTVVLAVRGPTVVDLEGAAAAPPDSPAAGCTWCGSRDSTSARSAVCRPTVAQAGQVANCSGFVLHACRWAVALDGFDARVPGPLRPSASASRSRQARLASW